MRAHDPGLSIKDNEYGLPTVGTYQDVKLGVCHDLLLKKSCRQRNVWSFCVNAIIEDD